MKFTIFGTAFALAIAAVSAQSFNIADIPPCATTCALASIGSTGCSATDLACVCKNSQFIDSLVPCITKACDPADQQKILTMATGLCASYGVTIPSNILSATPSATASVRGSASNTTSVLTTGATTTTPSTSTSTGGAAMVTGGSFIAAAMGAALFIL